MKDLNLLVWLTQLGISVALPLAGFVLLGVWLHEHLGWGQWTVWTGIVVGMICAINGFRTSVKLLDGIGNKNADPEPPSTSFNDHD